MKGGQVYRRYSAAFMAINLTVCFFSCCVYMVSCCRGISSGALALTFQILDYCMSIWQSLSQQRVSVSSYQKLIYDFCSQIYVNF